MVSFITMHCGLFVVVVSYITVQYELFLVVILCNTYFRWCGIAHAAQKQITVQEIALIIMK